MRTVAETVLPGDLLAAERLAQAIDFYSRNQNWEYAKACKRELDKLQAYKCQNDQLEILKQNLRDRGMNEIVIKIEELHIHG